MPGSGRNGLPQLLAAVTGATGTLGGKVAARPSEAGVPLRLADHLGAHPEDWAHLRA